MDAIKKIEAADIRKLVEDLILADRVMQRQGLVWGDQYEELSKPIRAARKALDEALASNAAEVQRLRAALELALLQAEHDMQLTGEEIRACRAALTNQQPTEQP